MGKTGVSERKKTRLANPLHRAVLTCLGGFGIENATLGAPAGPLSSIQGMAILAVNFVLRIRPNG